MHAYAKCRLGIGYLIYMKISNCFLDYGSKFVCTPAGPTSTACVRRLMTPYKRRGRSPLLTSAGNSGYPTIF